MGQPHTYHLCAVDGGGTGCRAAIARPDGTILARASGGPANYATDPDGTAAAVRATIDAARAGIGADAPDAESLVAHVGLAGIMTDADAEALAARIPVAHCAVSDDRLTSAVGALGERDGALLAIGTGSFAAIRRGGAVRFRGGWGFRIGDQASGAWLGRALLEHVLLAHDGLAPESDLTRATLARHGPTPAGLVAFAGAARPVEFAALAPAIVEAGAAGDPVGRTLMARGAEYLGRILASSGLGPDDALCLTGGLGPHYEPFLAPEHRARLRPPAGSALDGALALARRHLARLETPA